MAILREKEFGSVCKRLTDREVEFLSLAAFGCKNYLIAEKLFVSNSTVKKTLEKIFDKLSAKDRTNAVTLAFLHDILNVETLTKIADKYSFSDCLKISIDRHLKNKTEESKIKN